MTDGYTVSSGKTAAQVAVIVLNYNGYDDTIECVRSLEAMRYPNFSIIIVDNASPDGSGPKLQQAFPQHTVILSERNGGYAAGNNIGVRCALEENADYVLIINNDATVTPDLLDHLVDYAERHPEAGVLNARVYFPGTTELFSAAGRFNKLLCTGQNKGAVSIDQKETNELKETDYACGVLLLVRASVFRDVGLMDERYFMYFEDQEFSQRVLTKFKIVYIPEAVAYHKSGGGKGWKNYTELYLYYHTRNRFWVFEHASPLYKLYVALFTTVNSIAKTILMLQNMGEPGSKAVRQLKALWRGWRDGIIVFIRRNNAS
ncbi:MAG: glycosyltransferase family 2 protein [Acidobacteriota bacterium]